MVASLLRTYNRGLTTAYGTADAFLVQFFLSEEADQAANHLPLLPPEIVREVLRVLLHIRARHYSCMPHFMGQPPALSDGEVQSRWKRLDALLTPSLELQFPEVVSEVTAEIERRERERDASE